MYARCFTGFLACAVFAAWTFTAAYGDPQSRRAMRRGTVPMMVEPAVPQAVPQAAPITQPAAPAPPAAVDAGPSTTNERVQVARVEQSTEGRMLRGAELIGMTIWGPNQSRLGTVKDFIVDYQGDCPTLFFAMAPELSGWSEGYVIVPFDAFQIGFDQRQRTNRFVLHVAVDNLRRAPHVEINRWNSLRDPRFFAEARQFYQRVERKAARPELDTGREAPQGPEGRAPGEREMRQPYDRPHEPEQPADRQREREQTSPRQREASAPPRSEPPRDTRDDSDDRRRPPAKPERSPSPAPRSDSEIERREGPNPAPRSDSKIERREGPNPQRQPSPPERLPGAAPKSGSERR